MHKLGRIRFFFPSTKVNCETQTPVIYNPISKNGDIYEQMQEQMIQTLISQEPRPTNIIDYTYMQDFNKRLGYFIANENDERFDKLTPPPDLYENLRVAFNVSLLDKNFIIFRSDVKKSKDFDFNFSYEKSYIPLIESLESGVIGRELMAILWKLKVNAWEDGRLLCQIVDYRFEEPITYFRILNLSYSAISCLDSLSSSKVQSQQQKIENEKQILLRLYPQICTDPSPDVARAKSYLDWRQKMWRNRDRIDRKASEIQEEQMSKPLETGNIDITKLDKKIIIPAAISREFMNIIQNSNNS